MFSFSGIRDKWSNNGFEILVGMCLAFLICYGLYRRFSGKKGTWSDYSNYSPISERVSSGVSSGKGRGPKGGSKGELECRRVLENLFGKPFASCRPNFLSNPVTGGSYNLEIDCFNDGMRLGVEYNGVQHYKFSPYFHTSKDAFMNQKYRDDMKRRLCKENNVVLVEVPYTVKHQDLEGYLIRELTHLGFKF
jgi:hypothetical protein